MAHTPACRTPAGCTRAGYTRGRKKTLGVVVKCISAGVVALIFFWSAVRAAKAHVIIYAPPDRSCGAEVTTYDFDSSRSESRIRFLRRDRTLLLTKSLVSKDHAHGYRVVKGAWTSDSKYFVFSTVSSGGLQGGKFPTCVYIRKKNSLVPVDPVAGRGITDSDFQI